MHMAATATMTRARGGCPTPACSAPPCPRCRRSPGRRGRRARSPADRTRHLASAGTAPACTTLDQPITPISPAGRSRCRSPGPPHQNGPWPPPRLPQPTSTGSSPTRLTGATSTGSTTLAVLCHTDRVGTGFDATAEMLSRTPSQALPTRGRQPEQRRVVVWTGSQLLQQAQTPAALIARLRVADIGGSSSARFADPALLCSDRFHPSSADYAVIAAAPAPTIHAAAFNGSEPQRQVIYRQPPAGSSDVSRSIQSQWFSATPRTPLLPTCSAVRA
jgi:hypothetical protein